MFVLIRQAAYLYQSMFKSLLIQCVSIVANRYTESQVIYMSYTVTHFQ